MKRHVIVAACVLCVVALPGCGSGDETPQAADRPAERQAVRDRVDVRIGEAVVTADVADDDLERARGLGGRARLGRDAGMYFVLPDDSPRFWMKGMLIPLDMIWIKDGRVVDVTARVPKPRAGAADAELPTYSPARPADRVLEVSSGWARAHGVERGDRVRVSAEPAG